MTMDECLHPTCSNELCELNPFDSLAMHGIDYDIEHTLLIDDMPLR